MLNPKVVVSGTTVLDYSRFAMLSGFRGNHRTSLDNVFIDDPAGNCCLVHEASLHNHTNTWVVFDGVPARSQESTTVREWKRGNATENK
jgi:hypothetical protein